MKIKLNADVLYIMEVLRSHGHRADAVGGCVRDFLMGKEPFDIDITTSAKPEEMKKIFSVHVRHDKRRLTACKKL